MHNECLICKLECSITHWLHCMHKFCFLCIRRHLEKRNFCPECFKSPFSPTDLRTNEKQYNKIEKLPILVHSKEEHIRKELKKHKVNLLGGKGDLIQRYRELFINVDNERFREIPRNMDTIVRNLNKQESDNRIILKSIEKDMEQVKEAINKLRKKILNHEED